MLLHMHDADVAEARRGTPVHTSGRKILGDSQLEKYKPPFSCTSPPWVITEKFQPNFDGADPGFNIGLGALGEL
jgi:hypothetical protein